jgi:putative ABC transport system permease protein
MTLKNIVISNLRRRKARAVFVLVGLLIGVTTVVGLISLVQAMKKDINRKLEMYGANILIVPKTENLSLTYGGMSLGGFSFDMQEIRQDEVARIKTIKNAANVAAVGPMVLGPVTVGGHRILLAGVDFTAAQILRPWWSVKGKFPASENGVIIGSDAARVIGLKTGDKITVRGRALPVTGVLEATGSQDDGLIFAPLAIAQGILNKQDKISMVEVAALCSGCPIPEMVKQISAVLPSGSVMAIQQVVKGRMETISHFQKFSYGVSALVLLVGCLMVLVTMMGSVRERTVEIGIFRAMGYRKSHVLRIILLEAAMVAAVAGIAGYLAGAGATGLLLPLFTQGQGGHGTISFDPIMAAAALLASIMLGIAASLYPALTASRLDPNEALRAL